MLCKVADRIRKFGKESCSFSLSELKRSMPGVADTEICLVVSSMIQWNELIGWNPEFVMLSGIDARYVYVGNRAWVAMLADGIN